MIRKHVKARQDRHRAIGRIDAAHRCDFCRRELPKVGALLLLTPGGKASRFCDEGCRLDHIDALQTLEARR